MWMAMGGFIKQYEVQPDLDKLRAYKLTFQNLLDALGRGNSNAGGSYVTQGVQQYAIRGIGLLRSADDNRQHCGGRTRQHAHPDPRHRQGLGRRRAAPGHRGSGSG